MQAEKADGIGHTELLAAAKEVGLDQGAIERALTELERERGDSEVRDALAQRRRKRWTRSFLTFAVVVGAFMAMHFAGFFGAWVYWMAFGWGLAVALSALNAFGEPSEREVKREQRRRRRQEERRARAASRRKRRLMREQQAGQLDGARARRSKAAGELERAVEEGVGLLLKVAADGLRDASGWVEPKARRKASAEENAFDAFVRAKREHAAGQTSSGDPSGPPQVRVESGAASPASASPSGASEEAAGTGRATERQRRADRT